MYTFMFEGNLYVKQIVISNLNTFTNTHINWSLNQPNSYDTYTGITLIKYLYITSIYIKLNHKCMVEYFHFT